MSRIETANRNLIGPIMHGIEIDLKEQDQAKIAAWAVKTSMLGERLDAQTGFAAYTQNEREHFAQRREIPARTDVWIGRYSGENQVGLHGVFFFSARPDDPDCITGHCNTIFVGKLAIQVLKLRVPEKDRERPHPGSL